MKYIELYNIVVLLKRLNLLGRGSIPRKVAIIPSPIRYGFDNIFECYQIIIIIIIIKKSFHLQLSIAR